MVHIYHYSLASVFFDANYGSEQIMRVIMTGVGAGFIAPWGGEGIPHVPMNLFTGIISRPAFFYL
jgi:hypothetical protein